MDRKDVVKITLELIKEKKLEKTSIGKIVEKLKLSPGNLYYHFKNKNAIYEETLNYSFNEIIEVLDKVKMNGNNQVYLFKLTETLIRFLEKREEILFFLLSIKGTSFLNAGLETQNLLINFKKMFLNFDDERKVRLKLKMFLGSVFEVLYDNKILKNRNLSIEEVNEINMLFWGKL